MCLYVESRSQSPFEVFSNTEETWKRRLGCHAGRQEVSRCRTRGESRETCNMYASAHSGFETKRRCHQKSKTGVSVAPQKGLMSSEKFFKKRFSVIHNVGLFQLAVALFTRNICICINVNVTINFNTVFMVKEIQMQRNLRLHNAKLDANADANVDLSANGLLIWKEIRNSKSWWIFPVYNESQDAK